MALGLSIAIGALENVMLENIRGRLIIFLGSVTGSLCVNNLVLTIIFSGSWILLLTVPVTASIFFASVRALRVAYDVYSNQKTQPSTQSVLLDSV